MIPRPPRPTRTDPLFPYTTPVRSKGGPSACANVAHRRPKKPGNAGLFRLSSRSPPLLLLLYRFQGSPACRALAHHRDALERRTARPVRARQVAQAHQELAGDLAAGELERALEQLHPRRLVPRPAVLDGVRIEPLREAAVRVAQSADHPGVVDRRVHLQAVADRTSTRVGEE